MCIADAVKKIPIDKVEEIFSNGIILTGGGSELLGLNIMMEKVLGVTVTQPDRAIDCVAKGLSRINSFMPIRMRTASKNITASLTKYYANNKS
jgi:actin-like ATPase involved in cell morphogenesis